MGVTSFGLSFVFLLLSDFLVLFCYDCFSSGALFSSIFSSSSFLSSWTKDFLVLIACVLSIFLSFGAVNGNLSMLVGLVLNCCNSSLRQITNASLIINSSLSSTLLNDVQRYRLHSHIKKMFRVWGQDTDTLVFWPAEAKLCCFFFFLPQYQCQRHFKVKFTIKNKELTNLNEGNYRIRKT